MKALVYTEPNRVELQEREIPTLVAAEAVLRIDATGICGSGMHACHGHDPRRQPELVRPPRSVQARVQVQLRARSCCVAARKTIL
ncbi:hypothetical protein UB46_33485 [Burkholderiaceae bacterium 16]|nr:hypothetical protein UB46_33485 [Burkholderiaceae bacterium 16]